MDIAGKAPVTNVLPPTQAARYAWICSPIQVGEYFYATTNSGAIQACLPIPKGKSMQLIGYVNGKDRDLDKERLRKYCEDAVECIHVFEEPEPGHPDASAGHTLEYAIRTACARFADGLLVVNGEVLGPSEEDVSQKLRAARKKLVFVDGAPSAHRVAFGAASVLRLEEVVNNQYKLQGAKLRPSFGWYLVEGHMCLDLLEQTLFRWMLKMKSEGLTYAQITFALNEAGYKREEGGPWTTPKVFEVMKVIPRKHLKVRGKLKSKDRE